MLNGMACVQSMLRDAKLSNVHYFLHDERTYARFEEAANRQYDFAMIDGIIRSACVQTALQRAKPDCILYLDNSDKHPHGGDTRMAEDSMLSAAQSRAGRVLYFTDFAPTDFFANQGMMILMGRFAKAV